VEYPNATYELLDDLGSRHFRFAGEDISPEFTGGFSDIRLDLSYNFPETCGEFTIDLRVNLMAELTLSYGWHNNSYHLAHVWRLGSTTKDTTDHSRAIHSDDAFAVYHTVKTPEELRQSVEQTLAALLTRLEGAVNYRYELSWAEVNAILARVFKYYQVRYDEQLSSLNRYSFSAEALHQLERQAVWAGLCEAGPDDDAGRKLEILWGGLGDNAVMRLVASWSPAAGFRLDTFYASSHPQPWQGAQAFAGQYPRSQLVTEVLPNNNAVEELIHGLDLDLGLFV